MLVEVCANSLESALNAQKAGADRIELCTELGVGGVTPSYGLLKSVKEKINIPVRVLIRPRSGDFTYSDFEFDVMLKDISLCVDLGFDGVVSGVLHSDLSLDIERCKELIKAAKTLKFTFHRAFDWIKDPFVALEQLEHIGVDCILTSGQQKNALEGIDFLEALCNKAVNSLIMPGSGINPQNALLFKKKNFRIIHLSGTTMLEKNANVQALPMSSFHLMQEDKVVITDLNIIEDIVSRVK